MAIKKLSLVIVALLVFAACGSAETADTSSEPTTSGVTTTKAIGSDEGSGIETDVEVSFEVTGNSVAVFIKDAAGDTCIESTNPDCTGFYLNWEGNFDDLSKNIEYADPIVINDLNPGDEIDFLLMYQEVRGASEIVSVKRYPFSFNG
jgi:ABC-type glycerol-3-phosphate transport system substrate-binding protein